MATIVTPKFRVSYPNVFEPKLNKLSNQQEYSIEAIFDLGQDIESLKNMANKALAEKFGPDKNSWPNNIRTPFKNQASKAKEINGKKVLPAPYQEGAVFLNLKSKNKPGVVNKDVQPIIDSSEFYAGCYAVASISCYAYSKGGNNGVNFALVNIQKVADGEPLGGRTRPEDDFAPVTTNNDASADDLFN